MRGVVRRAGWFLRELRRIKGSSILIIGHPNADPDAVFSGLALKRLLLMMRPGLSTHFGAPESISEASKRILSELGFEDTIILDPSPDYDAIIMVDTSRLEQIGWLSEGVKGKAVYLIDHHMPDEKTLRLVKAALVDPEAPSTAELVFALYRSAGLKPEEKVAAGLLAALVYETRRFMFARPSTFRIVAELVKYCGGYRDVLRLVRAEMSYSERVARLKAASRLRLYIVDRVLIAVSHVGAYEGSAARALVELGADIAIVGSEDEGCRISSRRRGGIDVDLSMVLSRVAREFNGVGGGHPGAAGLKAEAPLDKVFSKILDVLGEVLGAELRPVG